MSLKLLLRAWLPTIVLFLSVVALAGCPGYVPEKTPQIVEMDVAPTAASLAVGATQQFAATGHLSDGTTEDLTASVTWASQTTSVATITTSGLATAKTAGTSTITATSGSVSGSASLTVTAVTLKSLSVTPADPTVAKNATQQFTATGTFSDGSTQDLSASVAWSSATASVATISSTGFATAIGAGSSKIQAVSGSVSGSTTLTVTGPTLSSIAVTPANPSIAKGLTSQFTATGTYSDNSTQNITTSVTWFSLTSSVATITSGGLAKGVGTGSSTIQATLGSVTGSTVLTITTATLTSIAVTPANPAIAVAATQQFIATGTYSDASTQIITNSVAWTSSKTSVATISGAGLATAVAGGSSTIQASSGAISGSTSLTVNAAAPTLTSIAVTPANPSIQNGATQQFTATGTYSDNSTKNITTTVNWNSETASVASISNVAGSNGLASSLNTGSTTIQAALGAISGSTLLTVTAANTPTLTVLVVSPQNPLITDASSVQAFTATGHYSDGTTQNLTSSATWTSSNSNVATVDAAGSATSQPLSSPTGYTSIRATVGAITGVSILSVSNHTSNPSGFAGVFMQHNDILRTGQNVNESTLTPTVVKSTTTFGKKFSQTIDGYAYAQPLYVPNVSIGGAVHNVIYVATENDSVYAFDADSNSGANAAPLWHANLIDTSHGAAAGAVAVTNSQVGCGDLVPKIGITSTPVIDPSTGTMYVETKSSEGSNYPHRLHAIDITTGNEKFAGPSLISATVNVPGGTVSFDGLKHLNRPGLLWLNGVIYIAYASHCDIGPYHGWLFAYDASNLTQKAAFLSTPEATSNGGLAGFWMSGAGVAADSNANIFITTGNGDFDTTNVPATLLGDSVLKLFFNGSSIGLTDYFTPYNQGSLDGGDTDLGSGGVLLLPDQPGSNPHELIQVGKQGSIYVINRDQFALNNLHYCKTGCNGTDAQIAQEIQGQVSGLWNMPAYWNGAIYFQGAGDSLKAFPVTNGVVAGTSSVNTGSSTIGYPGATPSISSSGSSNGIVWEIAPSGGSAVLEAFDPANGLASLYSSSKQAADKAGPGVKFSVPTIANGKVYVGTQTELDVYGTLP
ncbi:MAG TPA: Ig-like domain-containing protein [Candidatus Acidoferrales bacterium]